MMLLKSIYVPPDPSKIRKLEKCILTVHNACPFSAKTDLKNVGDSSNWLHFQNFPGGARPADPRKVRKEVKVYLHRPKRVCSISSKFDLKNAGDCSSWLHFFNKFCI